VVNRLHNSTHARRALKILEKIKNKGKPDFLFALSISGKFYNYSLYMGIFLAPSKFENKKLKAKNGQIRVSET
jgi:hypothetical protein